VEVKLHASLNLEIRASVEFEAEAVVSVMESLQCTKANKPCIKAWTGPEGSWRLRFPDFKIVSLKHRTSVTPRNMAIGTIDGQCLISC